MKKQISTLKKIKIWLFWPFFIVGIISLMIYMQFGEIKTRSFFLGAMIAIVPNAVFGFSSFRYFGALQSKQIWRSFVRGEVFKIALSVMIGFSLPAYKPCMVYDGFYFDAIYRFYLKLLVVESLRLGKKYDFKHRIY
jgi:F0F1-type ATP synthase assembly protein I